MNWSTFKYLLTLLLAIPVNLLAITDEPQEREFGIRIA